MLQFALQNMLSTRKQEVQRYSHFQETVRKLYCENLFCIRQILVRLEAHTSELLPFQPATTRIPYSAQQQPPYRIQHKASDTIACTPCISEVDYLTPFFRSQIDPAEVSNRKTYRTAQACDISTLTPRHFFVHRLTRQSARS